MHAAYDELPDDLKHTLEGRTATHDFEKFWEVMRQRPGSRRAPLTEEQKRKKPPVSQPLVRVHPLTGRRIQTIFLSNKVLNLPGTTPGVIHTRYRTVREHV